MNMHYTKVLSSKREIDIYYPADLTKEEWKEFLLFVQMVMKPSLKLAIKKDKIVIDKRD